MSIPDETSDALELRLGSKETSVACGAEVLDVPGVCAQRSELLVELRDQTEDQESLPLALSKQQMQAWLECAEQYAEPPGDEDSMVDYDIDEEEDDQLLLDALKAADFLRDHDTIECVHDELGSAVFGKRAMAAPTETEQARAVKIMLSVSHDSALRILQSLHERFLCDPPFASQPIRANHTHRLLQLLPRTFHPAIVLACCAIPGAERALRIQTFLHCQSSETAKEEAPAAACTAHQREERSGEAPAGPVHVCTPECATPTFQLLAAAAPLAGGSFEHAWDAEGGMHLSSASLDKHMPSIEDASRASASPAQKPPAKRLCCAVHADDSHAAEQPWRFPAGDLTRLDLEVPRLWKSVNSLPSAACVEPPRWCTTLELVQLRTLQELNLDVPAPPELHVHHLVPSLRHLKVFRQLSVKLRGFRRLESEESHEPPDLILDLLRGVCGLSQLAALHLDTGPFHYHSHPRHAEAALAQLSALPSLATFRISGCWLSLKHC